MMGSFHVEKKWQFPLIMISFVFIFFLATCFNMGLVSTIHSFNSILFFLPSRLAINQSAPVFVETKISSTAPAPTVLAIPRFAYLISGSKTDLDKLWRTLLALYHPLNHYIVHLDLESPLEVRLELASRIEKQPIFSEVGNVFMIQKANMVTYRGPTMISHTLHACAILLKRTKDWDWFINLSASDYPLVTQDDLLYTFSGVDRSLNFIEHTSHLGWKQEKRAMPLIIDPGLYRRNKSDVFWVGPKRTLPTAFKLFTGSAWMVLSRSFVEYVVWGWDNLPRTLLMYYTNFISSPEGYFQTVVCNEPELAKTVVNSDLHYISWDNPPKQHPHVLTINDTNKMIASKAAFARKFKHNDPVLDEIDKQLLHREKEQLFTPGGWCSGNPTCSKVGNIYKLTPGPGYLRLRFLVTRLTWMAKFGQKQCK
ncbi:beta-glucuronosyltransferase GlcAT14A [Vigna radiata var. radiata]|uniref:Beta-glucuronosyltransferase GlcAT14A n=1 Tax=Vigna radiata var. radiata TaxID=3916 RepID=A0A1S3TG69_VIGRR|nr:beta-glucuronosyltransferase GlcAT14A [Vigna radiata var. radiata]XP_014492760.1 beta-glucuronosyltransferase GlcAT14A [Vigna radiata var. radiata]